MIYFVSAQRGLVVICSIRVPEASGSIAWWCGSLMQLGTL